MGEVVFWTKRCVVELLMTLEYFGCRFEFFDKGFDEDLIVLVVILGFHRGTTKYPEDRSLYMGFAYLVEGVVDLICDLKDISTSCIGGWELRVGQNCSIVIL
jgi:hypothetical protein